MSQNYHIFSSGELKRENDTLAFRSDETNDLTVIPVDSVEMIIFHAQVRINTQLFQLLNKHSLIAVFFSWSGKFLGSFNPTQNPVSGELLVKQVQSTQNQESWCSISQSILQASVYNMRQTALYYADSYDSVQHTCSQLQKLESEFESITERDTLMGKEAEARKEYYSIFDTVTPDNFVFDTRSYNPPKNKLNALISFGNMMLYSNIESAIASTGLSPVISYVHVPGNRRQSLALDLGDIFKPVLIDRLIFRIVNRGQLNPSDFNTEVNNTLLTESGRKIFLKEYEEMLSETIRHPTLNRHVSYQTLLRLEAQKLKKSILTNEQYIAFKRWW